MIIQARQDWSYALSNIVPRLLGDVGSIRLKTDTYALDRLAQSTQEHCQWDIGETDQLVRTDLSVGPI